jgi:hypothetical protein
VYFAQEGAPPWASDTERFQTGYRVDIPFNAIDTRAASDAVQEMCRRFPERERSAGS